MNARDTTVLPGSLLAFLFLAGCTNTSTEPVRQSIADLAGSWEVTQFEISPEGTPGSGIDLIGWGGTLQISLQPEGNFHGMAVLPGAVMGEPRVGVISIPLTGKIRIMGANTLGVNFFPEIPPFFLTINPTYTISGRTLTISDDEVGFDFGRDGVQDPAVLRGVLVRR